MYGSGDLKPRIQVTDATVECPVLACGRVVARQRGAFQKRDEFYCPDHQIYISPSTFEYLTESANFLWSKPTDMALLRSIGTVKRESRMARDNSEDALTWNVFRFLERAGALAPCLAALLDEPVDDARLVYWSYSSDEDGTYGELSAARETFGEVPSRGSEPDLIVTTDSSLIIIEAKLFAKNETTPTRPEVCDVYRDAADGWAASVFTTDFRTVSEQHRKYELARFWLLGTWMAERMDKAFRLVNLVPALLETDIVSRFRPCLAEAPRRRFARISWEDIGRWVDANATDLPDARVLTSYLENKTGGYRDGRLQKAFHWS